MWPISLLRRPKAGPQRSRRDRGHRAERQRRQRFVPRLDMLEDRTLPVVLDPSGNTADLFGVQRTTTTVLIDGKGVLRYGGQFRQQGGGSAEAALKAVLAGQEVAVKTTPHHGGLIIRK